MSGTNRTLTAPRPSIVTPAAIIVPSRTGECPTIARPVLRDPNTPPARGIIVRRCLDPSARADAENEAERQEERQCVDRERRP